MDTPESLVGQVIGNYKIMRELGRGGMGVVYKALDQSLNRIVALKILAPHLAHDSAFVKRFRREAQAAARLDHPNIVTVHAVGEHEGLHYFSMTYVRGESLSAKILKAGQLEVSVSLNICAQVAGALAKAHRYDIVHRDIKPQNIMIDRAGVAKVMDFGLVKIMGAKTRLTGSGLLLGTPVYMSPEQCSSKPVDGRSDIYSLGVVLYEMLTGTVPFDSETPLAVMNQIVSQEFPAVAEKNLSVSTRVQDLIAKMSAKSPADRYQTASDLHRDLRECIRGESQRQLSPATATPGLTPEKTGEPPRLPKPRKLPSFGFLERFRRILAFLLGLITFRWMRSLWPRSSKKPTLGKWSKAMRVLAVVMLLVALLAGEAYYSLVDRIFFPARFIIQHEDEMWKEANRLQAKRRKKARVEARAQEERLRVEANRLTIAKANALVEVRRAALEDKFFAEETERIAELHKRTERRKGIVFFDGADDDFLNDDVEGCSPSYNLIGFIENTLGKQLKNFDDDEGDRFVAHTFTDLPTNIFAAYMEVRIRAGSSNDGICLLFVNDDRAWYRQGPQKWYRQIGSSRDGGPGLLENSWGDEQDTVLELDLGDLPLHPNLLLPEGSHDLIPEMNARGFLDFYVKEDTDVDYIRLTVFADP